MYTLCKLSTISASVRIRVRFYVTNALIQWTNGKEYLIDNLKKKYYSNSVAGNV